MTDCKCGLCFGPFRVGSNSCAAGFLVVACPLVTKRTTVEHESDDATGRTLRGSGEATGGGAGAVSTGTEAVSTGAEEATEWGGAVTVGMEAVTTGTGAVTTGAEEATEWTGAVTTVTTIQIWVTIGVVCPRRWVDILVNE